MAYSASDFCDDVSVILERYERTKSSQPEGSISTLLLSFFAIRAAFARTEWGESEDETEGFPCPNCDQPTVRHDRAADCTACGWGKSEWYEGTCDDETHNVDDEGCCDSPTCRFKGFAP